MPSLKALIAFLAVELILIAILRLVADVSIYWIVAASFGLFALVIVVDQYKTIWQRVRDMTPQELLLLTGIAGTWLFLTVAFAAGAWSILSKDSASSTLSNDQVLGLGEVELTKHMTLSGGMGGQNVFALEFLAVSRSDKEFELKSANITSAIDGTRQQLSVLATKDDDKKEPAKIGDIELIPPGARLELRAEFNPPQGLAPKDFLERWSRFSLSVETDKQEYRTDFVETDLMAFFSGQVGPRVRKKTSVQP